MLVYLIGTKAQYIKMAPVVLETLRRGLDYRLVYTGQHSETFEDLQRNYGLPPAHAVLVEQVEATDRQSFARWLWRSWRASRSPQMRRLWEGASAIVVHGDTASTLLGARIARQAQRPLVHVEAGLRSFNFFHPFPEEIIRVLVSRSVALHCCPDDTSAKNLQRANTAGEILVTSGNTMIDALRYAADAGAQKDQQTPPYGVFSLHRHENIFNAKRLARALEVLHALAAVAPIRFVLHPVTLKRLESLGLMADLRANPRIELVPRMDFFSFNRLLRGARFVATDGGSNQEECALLGIPCVLLRQATERQDGLQDKVVLTDLDVERSVAFARQACAAPVSRSQLPQVSPSRIIVDRLAALY